MKNTMNKIQENYIIAKAAWEAVCAVQKEKFNVFLIEKNLNEDDIADLSGDDFAEFNFCYETYAKAEIANCAAAWDNLKLAEKALIEFGISIAPLNMQEKLSNVVNWYFNKKQKMIDLVLNLDVSTLPKTLRV